MEGLQIPTPEGGLVWVHGNYNGTPVKILVDADGHLQTDVLSNALPTGAATSANQDTALTELNTKWGYDGVVREVKVNLNAAEGFDQLLTTVVPAGQVHVIQRIVARDFDKAIVTINIKVTSATVDYFIKSVKTTVANQTVVHDQEIVLGVGDRIKAEFFDCSPGDDIYLDIVGYYKSL